MCVFVTGATAVLVAEVEDERQNKEPSSYYEQKFAVTENSTKKTQNTKNCVENMQGSLLVCCD